VDAARKLLELSRLLRRSAARRREGGASRYHGLLRHMKEAERRVRKALSRATDSEVRVPSTAFETILESAIEIRGDSTMIRMLNGLAKNS
jgi:hypothetical protein